MPLALQFILILAIVIVAAKGGGLLSSRLGQPAVLGEILAGLFLGPSALGLLDMGFVSSSHIGDTLGLLSALGVVVLMFMAGVETDLTDLRLAFKGAVLAGTLGVLVPLGLGIVVSLPFGQDLYHSVYVGLVLTATSVSISARTLMELGALQRREGITILGAAVVDDVEAILALSVFIALAGGSEGAGVPQVALIMGKMLLFFALGIGVGLLSFHRISEWASALPISEGLAAVALVIALLYAWLSEWLGGVSMITGAYLAGALFSRTELRRTIQEKTHVLAYTFLVPIFFINIGLTANLRAFDLNDLLFVVVISVVAIISKIIGCGGGARLGGLTNLESLRVGVGMVSRGEVGLIIASAGLAGGLIGGDVFSATVVMVVVTTLVTPVLLKLAFTPPKAGKGEKESAKLGGSAN